MQTRLPRIKGRYCSEFRDQGNGELRRNPLSKWNYVSRDELSAYIQHKKTLRET